MTLEDKVAVVTGASRGIGKKIAEMLAQQGAMVVLGYVNNKAKAEEVAMSLQSSGARAIAMKVDVSDQTQVEKMIDSVCSTFGGVDILVNNAATRLLGTLRKADVNDWERVVQTNLNGGFYCIKYALPSMVEKGWGRIINISSVFGLRGYPGNTAYSASKAGIIGLTKSLAREVAVYGITVNAVAPGLVMTEINESVSTEDMSRFISSIPLQRPATPEEVAEVVVFLASKGSYITGEVITVDGGYNC